MKAKYIQLCEEEPSIPIFSRWWWLDATAGPENWDVAVVERDGAIVASLPYMLQKSRGRVFLAQPHLTQHLGPWLRTSSAKYANRLGQEKDLLTALIKTMPAFTSYSQNWNHGMTNWLPFYWHGFKQTTCYTYRLPDIADPAALWREFRENVRTDIRKATNRFNLKVREDLSVDDFLQLNKKTFERQHQRLPYSAEFVRNLDHACRKHHARQIFIAEDPQGRHHAGVYIVWDESTAYYVMGGGCAELRNSGATSLCMWEAIQFASRVTKSFDFEGSMMEPVERYFRAFGSVQTPYFSVSKVNSRFQRACLALREFGRCFR